MHDARDRDQLSRGAVQGQVGQGTRVRGGAAKFESGLVRGVEEPSATVDLWSGIGEQAELTSGALACEIDSGRVWIRVRLG